MTNKYVATISYENGKFDILENTSNPYELDITALQRRAGSKIVGVAFQVNGINAGSVLFEF